MLITLATTPQSNSRLLIRGLKLYIASFKHVFGLSLLFSMIIFIPQFVAITQNLSLIALTQYFYFYNLFFIFVGIAALFVFTSLLWRMRCVVTLSHESILDDFKIATSKIMLIIGVSLIYFIILSLFMFFLIMLPALTFLNAPSIESVNVALLFSWFYFCIVIYIFFAFIYALPLILTENTRVWGALKKSFYLVRGNWWRVISLLIIPIVVYYLILVIIQNTFFIDLTIRYAQPYDFRALLILAFNVVLIALFVPLEGALLLLQLRDLELRKQV